MEKIEEKDQQHKYIVSWNEEAESYYYNYEYDLAMAAYERSAFLGDAEAQYQLGGMYEEGLGASQDYVAAMKWYRKAAEQGHAAAKERLLKLKDLGYGK